MPPHKPKQLSQPVTLLLQQQQGIGKFSKGINTNFLSPQGFTFIQQIIQPGSYISSLGCSAVQKQQNGIGPGLHSLL
jgi:hypothetical protein